MPDRRPVSRERPFGYELDTITWSYRADVRQLANGRWLAEVRADGSVAFFTADDPDTALREANARL